MSRPCEITSRSPRVRLPGLGCANYERDPEIWRHAGISKPATKDSVDHASRGKLPKLILQAAAGLNIDLAGKQ
jgi:hypothetical protein